MSKIRALTIIGENITFVVGDDAYALFVVPTSHVRKVKEIREVGDNGEMAIVPAWEIEVTAGIILRYRGDYLLEYQDDVQDIFQRAEVGSQREMGAEAGRTPTAQNHQGQDSDA